MKNIIYKEELQGIISNSSSYASEVKACEGELNGVGSGTSGNYNTKNTSKIVALVSDLGKCIKVIGANYDNDVNVLTKTIAKYMAAEATSSALLGTIDALAGLSSSRSSKSGIVGMVGSKAKTTKEYVNSLDTATLNQMKVNAARRRRKESEAKAAAAAEAARAAEPIYITPEYEQMMFLSGDVNQMRQATNRYTQTHAESAKVLNNALSDFQKKWVELCTPSSDVPMNGITPEMEMMMFSSGDVYQMGQATSEYTTTHAESANVINSTLDNVKNGWLDFWAPSPDMPKDTLTPEMEMMMILSGDVDQFEQVTSEYTRTHAAHGMALNAMMEGLMQTGETIYDGIMGAGAATSIAQLESYGVLDPVDRETHMKEIEDEIKYDYTHQGGKIGGVNWQGWNSVWESDTGKQLENAAGFTHDSKYYEQAKGAAVMGSYVAMGMNPIGWGLSAAAIAGESYQGTLAEGGTLNDAIVAAVPGVALDFGLNAIFGGAFAKGTKAASGTNKAVSGAKVAESEAGIAVAGAKSKFPSSIDFPSVVSDTKAFLGDVRRAVGGRVAAPAYAVAPSIRFLGDTAERLAGKLFGGGKAAKVADEVADVSRVADNVNGTHVGNNFGNMVDQANQYKSITQCNIQSVDDANLLVDYFRRNPNGSFSDFSEGELTLFRDRFDDIIDTQEYKKWLSTKDNSEYSDLFEFINNNYSQLDNTIVDLSQAAKTAKAAEEEANLSNYSPEIRQWFESLNDYDKKVLSDYTKGGNLFSESSAGNINYYLRGNKNVLSDYKSYGYSSPEQFAVALDRRISTIDQLIENAPKLSQDTTVYRYVDIDALDINNIDEVYKLLDTPYKDNGFMSSVLGRRGYRYEQQLPVELEITLPKGTPVADITALNAHGEHEVLFPRNIDFTISGISRAEDGKYTVKLQPNKLSVKQEVNSSVSSGARKPLREYAYGVFEKMTDPNVYGVSPAMKFAGDLMDDAKDMLVDFFRGNRTVKEAAETIPLNGLRQPVAVSNPIRTMGEFENIVYGFKPVTTFGDVKKLASFASKGKDCYAELVSASGVRKYVSDQRYVDNFKRLINDDAYKYTDQLIYNEKTGLFNGIQTGKTNQPVFYQFKSMDFNSVDCTGRLYLNISDYANSYYFAEMFMAECKKRGIPFQLKVGAVDNYVPSESFALLRDESIVIYVNDNTVLDCVNLCKEVKANMDPRVFETPPALTSKIDGVIGYADNPEVILDSAGDVKSAESFNRRRSNWLVTSYNDVANDYVSRGLKVDIEDNNFLSDFYKALKSNCGEYNIDSNCFSLNSDRVKYGGVSNLPQGEMPKINNPAKVAPNVSKEAVSTELADAFRQMEIKHGDMAEAQIRRAIDQAKKGDYSYFSRINGNRNIWRGYSGDKLDELYDAYKTGKKETNANVSNVVQGETPKITKSDEVVSHVNNTNLSSTEHVLEDAGTSNKLDGDEELIDASKLPLSDLEDQKNLQQKWINGEKVSILAGRDGAVTKLGDYELKPNYAYRSTSYEAVLDYLEHNAIRDNGSGKGYPNVDWYIGGASSNYGRVIIEAPAKKSNFTLTDHYGGVMSGHPYVRQAYSSNANPMSFDEVTKIIFVDSKRGYKVLKIVDTKNDDVARGIQEGNLLFYKNRLENQKAAQGLNFPSEKQRKLDDIIDELNSLQKQATVKVSESRSMNDIQQLQKEFLEDPEISKTFDVLAEDGMRRGNPHRVEEVLSDLEQGKVKAGDLFHWDSEFYRVIKKYSPEKLRKFYNLKASGMLGVLGISTQKINDKISEINTNSEAAKVKGEENRINWLYEGGKIPTSDTENAKYLETFPIEYLDVDGTIKQRDITMHKNLKKDVQEIFKELSEIGYKVDWTGSGHFVTMEEDKLKHPSDYQGNFPRSAHCYGVALDLNPMSNAYVNGSDSFGHYKPGEDPLSVTPEVVEIFKKHGFYWGGDWQEPKDYMHFSYFDH